MNTWAGQWTHQAWDRPRPYVASIEDPFDSLENPGRSITRISAEIVAQELNSASKALMTLRDEKGVLPDQSYPYD